MKENERIELARLLFPEITKTTEDIEALYPERILDEGAKITRFAPSPTGYLHFGGLFGATADMYAAKRTNGVFILRIEDTDKKREVEDGIKTVINGLADFGITADEGVISETEEKGSYGPYVQSKRKEIYGVFAKSLVEKGFAYPCFCSAEELDSIREEQENKGITKGYYGDWAKGRDLTLDDIKKKIKDGIPFVIRLKSSGSESGKIRFADIIRGNIEMSQNYLDIVLLKTDKIPTYHFAHVVDDHLMRVTTVIRGDEWIASTPIHLELFHVLDFKPVKYAHTSAVLKEENGGKRKLSKRKDPEAAVSFFIEQGYPKEAVNEYVLTLLNSNFEDWRRANKTAELSNFPFDLKKMGISGALFDLVKLNDVSKNIIGNFSAEKLYNEAVLWTERYDKEYFKILSNEKEKCLEYLGIGRGGKKPRKDIGKLSELKDFWAFMHNDLYDENLFLPEKICSFDACSILERYIGLYNEEDDNTEWFEKVKSLCEPFGYASNMKEYKANPESFKGHVGDVSTVIRIAITGRCDTPDLCSIMKILGKDEVLSRLSRAVKFYGGIND